MLSRGDNQTIETQVYIGADDDREQIGFIRHNAPCVYRAYHLTPSMGLGEPGHNFLGASSSLKRAIQMIEDEHYATGDYA